VAGGAGIARLPLRDFVPRGGIADVFPAGAVEFLKREGQTGTVFNEYGWGGYLIWHLYPAYRVSIDGRAAVYGPERFARYIEIDDLRPGWRASLEGLGARYAVIRPGGPLATVLRLSPDWDVVYEDRVAVVLVRREGIRAG
jgi:hypothetical protein